MPGKKKKKSKKEETFKYMVEAYDSSGQTGYYDICDEQELAEFFQDLYAYVWRRTEHEDREPLKIEVHAKYDPDKFEEWCAAHQGEDLDKIPIEETPEEEKMWEEKVGEA